MKDMRTMGFWAEGVAGKVHLEIKSVAWQLVFGHSRHKAYRNHSIEPFGTFYGHLSSGFACVLIDFSTLWLIVVAICFTLDDFN